MRKIVLNGTECELRLDLRAMRDFEQRAKKRLLGMLFALSEPQKLDLSAEDIAVLIWAMIGGKDSKLTIDDVLRAVDITTAREIFAAVTDAILDAFPELGQPAGTAGGAQTDPPAGGSSGQSA